MGTEISTGTVERIDDYGSVVVFTIREGDKAIRQLAADGALAETYEAADAIPPGTLVEFGTEGWGDLQFISPVDD